MKHNWEVCRIGHFCDVKTGKLDANASCENGLYPFFTCSKDALRINSFSYNCECVLIAGNGDLNVKYYNGKFDAYQRTYIITVKPKFEDIISVEYLYNFFRLYISTLREKSVGGIIKFIKLGDITNAVINVPSLKVQKIIVSELNKINDTIEDCRELLRNLDALAQSLFYDTFGDPITNPKGWEMKHFKEILYKIGSGATPKGGKQSYQGGNISLIRSLNVYNTYFKYDDLAKINANQAYELRNVEVQFDDVLLNITGASVARCFIVPKDTLPARVNQHVAILRPNNKFIRPKFLHRLIITPSFQNFLIGTARGKSATREALPKATLEMIKIPVPPISLQEQFAARIEQIEEQKKAVEQTIAELQTLLDSRMDYWFN